MSEGRMPSPEFDSTRYERPNKDWICGNACDGCPCRIGPSPSGECRASSECSPVLDVKPSEKKGTWRCTRPKEWGGPCEAGPLPDGSCCRDQGCGCGHRGLPVDRVRWKLERRLHKSGAALEGALRARFRAFGGDAWWRAGVRELPSGHQHGADGNCFQCNRGGWEFLGGFKAGRSASEGLFTNRSDLHFLSSISDVSSGQCGGRCFLFRLSQGARGTERPAAGGGIELHFLPWRRGQNGRFGAKKPDPARIAF